MNAFTVDVLMWPSRRHDDTANRWAAARKVVLAISLTIACQTAFAQAMYRIKPLGYLGGCTSSVPTVVALNGKDEVAGTACNAHGDSHAFLWRNDGHPMVDLGPDEVGSTSAAVAINASGLVAGTVSAPAGCGCGGEGDFFAFESSGDGTAMRYIPSIESESRNLFPLAMNGHGQLTGFVFPSPLDAFLWTPDATPDGQFSAKDSLAGEDSEGEAINDSGQIAGSSLSGFSSDSRAVVWMNDGQGIRNLGTLRGSTASDAYFINAAGQVAGISWNATRRHVFFWRNDGTRMRDLGTLGGLDSYPNALNDSGQVAGYSNKANGATHAFVWMNDGTAMKDLGTLGGTHSSADDINFSGQVTGNATLPGDAVTHAFLWRHDGTKIADLNTLIDPTDPLKSYITLTGAPYVNDSGDILAYGTDSRTGLENVPYLLQGTVLTLSPRLLAFGSHPINTTSAAKSVTVTNTSAKVVAITSIALKGVAAGQFGSSNNCGSSLVGHATCTIKVTFKPTNKGAKSATLNVNGGGGGLRTVTLTGTGT